MCDSGTIFVTAGLEGTCTQSSQHRSTTAGEDLGVRVLGGGKQAAAAGDKSAQRMIQAQTCKFISGACCVDPVLRVMLRCCCKGCYAAYGDVVSNDANEVMMYCGI